MERNVRRPMGALNPRMSSFSRGQAIQGGNIVTLTLNPAVDLATEVERIEPSHKIRCGVPRRDAGGGGINVARAVRRLGGACEAVYLAGGPTGDVLDGLVRADDLPRRRVSIAGETRENVSITERATGAQYRFVLPGPMVAASEAKASLEALAECAHGGYVVASGSLPPGLDQDFYRSVAEIAVRNGARFVLDTSGPALTAALGANVFLIKPSRRELSEVEGRALSTEKDCLLAAQRIVASHRATLVAVSLGKEGAILVGEGIQFTVRAPHVEAVSSVGAGDSFLGALILEISRGSGFGDALRCAVAAGTASLLSAGTGLCRREDVDWLLPKVRVEPSLIESVR